MREWNAGYITDFAYTFGYYTELNPLRIKLAFLNNGLVYPECGTACELGFGQGVSTNIHAAASYTKWYGNDFSPAQASFGQEIAREADTNASLFDDSFEEFIHRKDLPDFDYICLHGIWSWVSDANRTLIVDFIKRKLKVGGVLYVSYNTMPGLASFAPIRHLLSKHSEIMGSKGSGYAQRIDEAIGFTESLLTTDPQYSRANPQVNERFNILKGKNRSYLAHEYLNKTWEPMYFATTAKWLEPAKLQYACSAHYLNQVDALNLTPEQLLFLSNISDNMFKETVKDFMVNSQFRRDYWVKGLRPLSPLEKMESLSKTRVMLVTPLKKITLKITGAIGQSEMNPQIYNPIIGALSDYKPKTIGNLIDQLQIDKGKVLEAILVLIGASYVSPVQDEQTSRKAKTQTDKLNKYLTQKARDSNEFCVLASPVTGGGIPVTRFQQQFIAAINNGLKKQEEWVRFGYEILESLNQRLVINGAPLETKEENLAELREQAKSFEETELPLLIALKII